MRQLKITKSITNRENASLDKYLQEIGHEELISVEEEAELARRIKKVTARHWRNLPKLTCALLSLLQNNIRTKDCPYPTLSTKATLVC